MTAKKITEKAIRHAAAQILGCAGFRTARHQHERIVNVVGCGLEFATSTTSAVRPESVGLPRAYARKAFHVTTSVHRWGVSDAIFEPRVRALQASAPAGVVYLSRRMRIVQGPGTSLRTEHLDYGVWS